MNELDDYVATLVQDDLPMLKRRKAEEQSNLEQFMDSLPGMIIHSPNHLVLLCVRACVKIAMFGVCVLGM